MVKKAFRLRKSAKADKGFIYKVKKDSNYKYVDEIWGWDEDYQQRDFDLDFNTSDFSVIVVDHTDIGFIQINSSDDIVNITEIHVVEDYRGRGVGTAIIRELIQQAASTGKNVQIGCFKANKRAFKLYTSLGFRKESATETHYLLRLDHSS